MQPFYIPDMAAFIGGLRHCSVQLTAKSCNWLTDWDHLLSCFLIQPFVLTRDLQLPARQAHRESGEKQFSNTAKNFLVYFSPPCCITDALFLSVVLLFAIQISVIATVEKMTGIGPEIMKFSHTLYHSGWNYTLGDEWIKMKAVQLWSIKLASCHQGNQRNYFQAYTLW